MKKLMIYIFLLGIIGGCKYNIISPPDIINQRLYENKDLKNIKTYVFDDFENVKKVKSYYLGYGNKIPRVDSNSDPAYVKSGKYSLKLKYKIANGSWGVGVRRDFKLKPIDISGIKEISLWVYPKLKSTGRYFILQLKNGKHSWKSKKIPLMNNRWQLIRVPVEESPLGFTKDGNYSFLDDLKHITSIRFRIDNNKNSTPIEEIYFDKVLFKGYWFNSESIKDTYVVDKNVYINNFRRVKPDLKYKRGLWVWKTSMIFQNNLKEFFRFCKVKNINLIFIYTGMQKGHLNIKYFEKKFKIFNKMAHKNGIKVHALDGDPIWTYSENHNVALSRAMDIINFNKKVLKIERFDGIHHDVEPHGLKEVKELKMKDDMASQIKIENIYKQYIELCRKTEALVDKYKDTQNIEFGIDIPFWYKQPTRSRDVTINGVKKAISDFLTDIVDNIGIMDYKDSGEGMIRFALDEIEYADNIPGKKIYIGANVNDSKEEITTFWQEGEEYMEKELDKVDEAFANHPSYAGLAIHSFKTYRILRP